MFISEIKEKDGKFEYKVSNIFCKAGDPRTKVDELTDRYRREHAEYLFSKNKTGSVDPKATKLLNETLGMD